MNTEAMFRFINRTYKHYTASIAATGSTYADAAQLTGAINVVTAASVDGTKGVQLPAYQRWPILVTSLGSGFDLKVYPPTGGSINSGSTNGAVSILSAKTVMFVPVSDTAYRTLQVDSFGAYGMKTDKIAESTSGNGISVDGVILKDGGVTVAGANTGFYHDSVQSLDPSGSNQANAIASAAITAGFVCVANANNAKGVALPSAVAGRTVTVKVETAGSTVLVYPQLSAAINALGANNAYNTAQAGSVMFKAKNTTMWYSIPLAG